MSLIRKHVAVLQAWACLDLVLLMFLFLFRHEISKFPALGRSHFILGVKQGTLLSAQHRLFAAYTDDVITRNLAN